MFSRAQSRFNESFLWVAGLSEVIVRHRKTIIFYASYIILNSLQQIVQIGVLRMLVIILCNPFWYATAPPLYHIKERVEQENALGFHVFFIQRNWPHWIVVRSVLEECRLNHKDYVLHRLLLYNCADVCKLHKKWSTSSRLSPLLRTIGFLLRWYTNCGNDLIFYANLKDRGSPLRYSAKVLAHLQRKLSSHCLTSLEAISKGLVMTDLESSAKAAPESNPETKSPTKLLKRRRMVVTLLNLMFKF